MIFVMREVVGAKIDCKYMSNWSLSSSYQYLMTEAPDTRCVATFVIPMVASSKSANTRACSRYLACGKLADHDLVWC